LFLAHAGIYKYPMRKFIDIISNLNEAKQVGVIYHFTKTQKAFAILDEKGTLKPKQGGGISFNGSAYVIDRHRDWISFTRNHNLIASAAAGGNGKEWGEMRIAFDGDLLSQRFSINPYHDEDGQLTRHDGQAEERVMGEMRNIKHAIIQMDWMAERFYESETDFDNWAAPPNAEDREKYSAQAREDIQTYLKLFEQEGIPVNIVKDFSRPVRVITP
jgi:hypothetical protein